MFNKSILFALLASVPITFAVKYQVQFRDVEIFIPCPQYPDNFLDKFMKWPENFTLLPDDSYYISGNILLIYDYSPLKKYPIAVEVFKRERGSWQKTIYTMKREDFCVAVFDPSEPWQGLVNKLPAEQHKCPLAKGQIFSIDAVTEQTFDMPSPAMEGEYWIRLEMGDKQDLHEFGCSDVYLTVYRA